MPLSYYQKQPVPGPPYRHSSLLSRPVAIFFPLTFCFLFSAVNFHPTALSGFDWSFSYVRPPVFVRFLRPMQLFTAAVPSHLPFCSLSDRPPPSTVFLTFGAGGICIVPPRRFFSFLTPSPGMAVGIPFPTPSSLKTHQPLFSPSPFRGRPDHTRAMYLGVSPSNSSPSFLYPGFDSRGVLFPLACAWIPVGVDFRPSPVFVPPPPPPPSFPFSRLVASRRMIGQW